MNKKSLIQKILTQLLDELDVLVRSAKDAHTSATHEETQAKSKYDTFALEASYLAQGQAKRVSELERAVEAYKKLSPLTFTAQMPVALTSVVLLQKNSQSPFWIFLGPDAGGFKVNDADLENTVITIKSPLGQALLGRNVGETVEVEQGNLVLEYELLDLQ